MEGDNEARAPDVDDVSDLARDIPTAAGALLAIQRIAAQAVRQKSLEAYGGLTEANMLVTGVIGSVLVRSNGRISKSKLEPASHEATAQIAAFVIGIDIVESAISEGRYLQASALLRQEMEGLTALDEIKKGKRRHGKTPNVRNNQNLNSVNHLYEDLSAATHLAQSHVVAAATEYAGTLEGMPDETVVRRYVPGFDVDLARKLYALHTLMMLHLAEHVRIDLEHTYEEQFTLEENDALQRVLHIMLEEKCIVVAQSY